MRRNEDVYKTISQKIEILVTRSRLFGIPLIVANQIVFVIDKKIKQKPRKRKGLTL